MDIERILQRRKKLATMLEDGLVIITNAEEKYRNFHTTYLYRHDSNFYYLTGFVEPSSVLVLHIHDHSVTESILFCLPKNYQEELWTGERAGLDKAKELVAVDRTLPYEHFLSYLKENVRAHRRIYNLFGINPSIDNFLHDIQQKSHLHLLYDGSIVLEDIHHQIGCLRLIKDSSEVKIIEEAAAITHKAHCQAAKVIAPGRWEYEVEAELMHAFFRNGSRAPAYNNIVASGDRACILHYIDNNRQMQAGELLLIDAGCENKGYASDVTRTYPVSGRYEGVAKDVYELVLSAQKEAIACAAVGRDMYDLQMAAIKVLSQGLIDFGIIAGSLDAAIEQRLYFPYFMHRIGHTLGADVHDTGFYDVGHRPNLLQEGVIITVEPGLYFWPSEEVPEAFRGIGVRIEDDVLIASPAPCVLTSAIPKECQDVEDMMRS